MRERRSAFSDLIGRVIGARAPRLDVAHGKRADDWTNVWIASDPAGHVQATGRDARGRKQYRYHPGWTAARDAEKYDRPVGGLSQSAYQRLFAHAWPGNVRELQNVLARSAILARGGTIQPSDLEPPAAAAGESPTAAGSLVLRDALAETEQRLIRLALEQEKWNRTQAARVLGISRRQLFDKIRRYGIQEG